MAKRALTSSQLRLLVPAGKATPTPPVGPALGQRGVKAIDFCKQFNERTKHFTAGTPIPVRLTVRPDRTFTFHTTTPPTAYLLKQAAGIKLGASKPGSETVAQVSVKAVYEIARLKQQDAHLQDLTLEQLCRMIAGGAKSIGIEIGSAMGKWAEKAYDDELLAKIKRLFEATKGKTGGGLADTGREISFEEFVEALDENDKFVKKLFEHLVQETASCQARLRRRRLRLQGAPYTANTAARNQNRHAHISPYLENILSRGFLDGIDSTNHQSSLENAGYGYLQGWFTPTAGSSSTNAQSTDPPASWLAVDPYESGSSDSLPYSLPSSTTVSSSQLFRSFLPPRNINELSYITNNNNNNNTITNSNINNSNNSSATADRRNRRLSLLNAIAASRVVSGGTNNNGTNNSSLYLPPVTFSPLSRSISRTENINAPGSPIHNNYQASRSNVSFSAALELPALPFMPFNAPSPQLSFLPNARSRSRQQSTSSSDLSPTLFPPTELLEGEDGGDTQRLSSTPTTSSLWPFTTRRHSLNMLSPSPAPARLR